MKFEWAIKFGDILTTATILVSVAALVVSWSRDRLTRESEQADRVRSAAAGVLTKLDRWQRITLSLYDWLQPLVIDVSEGLRNDFDVVQARDRLWKEVAKVQADVSRIILEEEIGTSYVGLLSHFPVVRKQFRNAFGDLSETEKQISNEFLEQSQYDVLSFKGKREEYTSAILGNALRTTAATFQRRLLDESNKIIDPLRDLLFEIIAKPNKEILGAERSRPA